MKRQFFDILLNKLLLLLILNNILTIVFSSAIGVDIPIPPGKTSVREI